MASELKTRADVVAKINALELKRSEEEARLKHLEEPVKNAMKGYLDLMNSPAVQGIRKSIEGIDAQISGWQHELKQFPAHTTAPHSSPHKSPGQSMSAIKFLVTKSPLDAKPQWNEAILKPGKRCPPPPPQGKEAGLQSWLVALVEDINFTNEEVKSQLIALQTPGVTLIVPNASWKPDGIVYRKHLLHQEGGVVAAIELKALGKCNEDASTLQVLNYLHAILTIQPSRVMCYGILTDGKVLQIIKAGRLAGGKFEFTVMWSGEFDQGKGFIHWLLTTPLADLGYSPPKINFDGTPVELTKHLGTGQHASGYEVSLGGETFVVKHFTEERAAEKERKVCNAVAQASNTLTKLYKLQPEEKNFVAVTPKGKVFDQTNLPNQKHVISLVAALTELHAYGMVHGDVCRQNIYSQDADTALLNDWSHVRWAVDFAADERMDEQAAKDFDKLNTALVELDASYTLRQPVIDAQNSPKKRKTESS